MEEEALQLRWKAFQALCSICAGIRIPVKRGDWLFRRCTTCDPLE